MAKVGCKVKFEWRGWNRAGYAEVMNGGGTQALLDQKAAAAAAAAANSSFSPHAGEGAGYAVDELRGTLAKGRIIYTQTPHANASERRHNRLQGIFGGRMMDAERVAALAIQNATGVPCRLEVPTERPNELVTVTLSATSADRFQRTARLTAQSWAKTRRRAHEIAEAVEAACASIEDDPNVLSCLPDGTYRWDDPETGSPRYQTNINMRICE